MPEPEFISCLTCTSCIQQSRKSSLNISIQKHFTCFLVTKSHSDRKIKVSEHATKQSRKYPNIVFVAEIAQSQRELGTGDLHPFAKGHIAAITVSFFKACGLQRQGAVTDRSDNPISWMPAVYLRLTTLAHWLPALAHWLTTHEHAHTYALTHTNTHTHKHHNPLLSTHYPFYLPAKPHLTNGTYPIPIPHLTTYFTHSPTDLFLLAILDSLCRHADGASLACGRRHLGVELELDALLGEAALEVFGHLHVNSQTTYMAQELHAGHLCSQALPHWALGYTQ